MPSQPPWIGYDTAPRPSYVWDYREGKVRVTDRILSCLVFLGIDEHGPFAPLGTAFLTVTSTGGFHFQHMITARHVVEDVQAKQICVRINTKNGGFESTYVDPKDWLFHPDPKIDLAICPSHIPAERYDILHMNVDDELATTEIIEDEQIGIGDDIFMSGLFTWHVGDTANRPILRTGTIAAMARDDEKIYTSRGHISACLIEARSIAGLSGSPVFVHMAPLRVMADGGVRHSQKKVHYFLGVMQGHITTKEPNETISQDDETPGDMSTGIGVVIPGERVRELINLPKLQTRREELAEQQKTRKGRFIEDSAAKSESVSEVTSEADTSLFERLGGKIEGRQA